MRRTYLFLALIVSTAATTVVVWRSKASQAQLAIGDRSKVARFDRLKDKVLHAEAVSQAQAEMVADDVGDQFARLEKQDEIERLLAELKARRGLAN